MKITGTIINYYYHCKRQCYLFSNNVNLEDNSEDVRIGRILHEIKAMDNKNREIKFDNIVIDEITEKYVIEMKKSDADVEASKMQLLFYLEKLKEKGIIKDGRLKFIEKNKSEKTEIIRIDDKSQEELDQCKNGIMQLLDNNCPPEAKLIKGCKKCAYYEYCFI